MATEQTYSGEMIKGCDSESISGVGRLNDRLLIVVDLERLFAGNELTEMARAA